MFPKRPEDLSTLSAKQLKALRLEFLHAIRQNAGRADLTDEDKAEIAAARTFAQELVQLAADAEDAEAADAAAADEAAAEAAAAEAAAEQAAADAAAQAAAEAAGEGGDGGEGEPPAPTPPVETVHTSLPAPTPVAGAAAVDGPIAPTRLVRLGSGSGTEATFGSWTEVAEAFIERMKGLRSDAPERSDIAKIVGSFSPDQVLSDSPVENLAKFAQTGYHRFDQQPDDITAQVCAPIQNTYDMACWNTDRRPVRASLPVYKTPDTKRGGITVYPSPTLEDIDGGFGIWTQEDDADPEQVKSCAEITCATPIEYRWYAIYRCITIKNMTAMTFPELVEAFLNRLAASQARLAERTMLEQMANSADTISAHELGYNATVTIGTNLLNYLALYQEQQRWDTPGMIAWMPRWILFALKADFMRRRSTNGGRITVPSDDDIRRLFNEVGVTPVFFLDSPSWVTPIPNLQTNNVLGQFPRNLEVLVAPTSKFRSFDEGNMTVGVQPNNVYRVGDDLLRNRFRMFWESTEGVLDTNTCPAHIIEFNNLCFNGQQIADLVINCEGGDEVGPAS